MKQRFNINKVYNSKVYIINLFNKEKKLKSTSKTDN